ncbi:beta-lactamase/transpeptidase-like protein [Diplogelasinospora grovesii]|uniref:Beta-lactamase/transpeptidase-like protein n=1 Tax=Diplogelasinospora grovesii TaxID=303347 RepID=A0AAN6MZL6_9PEZI|nr:beta-lactamase/transpeptidase-like protein [Diplogelasinospora grovesii]
MKCFRANPRTAGILERLAHPSTRATISDICELTGTAGLSLGVIHGGEVIHQSHFGYRDVDKKVGPNANSTYHVGSMSKAMVAASFASLVHKGKLSWSTPLKELVPEYADPATVTRLAELKSEANIEDLLAMRTGLPTANGLWVQQCQQLLVPKTETARIFGLLEPQHKFRLKMSYCNWSYALAGEILERLAGSSLEQSTKGLRYDRLGLGTTTFGDPAEDNHVTAYMTLTDRSPLAVPCPPLRSGRLLAAAGAAESSLTDLLTYYKALLKAAADQKESGKTETEGSPFFDVQYLWGPRAVINEHSHYGLGWVVTELPGQGGLVGVNSYESPRGLPTIAKGIPEPVQLVYHNGAMAGALSAVYLLPETQTGIVVLSNTFALCDAPDWIAQFLVEASQNARTHHVNTRKILAEERTLGAKPRELSKYVGRYYNSIGNFYLDVAVHGDNGLRMTTQGYPFVHYDLSHYHYDVFAGDCDRDAETRRTIYPQWSPNFHRISSHQLQISLCKRLFKVCYRGYVAVGLLTGGARIFDGYSASEK